MALLAVLSGLIGCLLAPTGCGGGLGGAFEFLGAPFLGASTGGTATGPTTTGRQTGASLGTSTVAFTDPCLETQQARKFVRISMRNLADSHVHYFLALIAYVNGTTYPDGGVCSTDIPLYQSFGYQLIQEGQEQVFGNYCIRGPALLYLHKNGQFRSAGGVAGTLGSAIAPAQGATPTYDTFFGSSGAMVPVPDRILFHNPGTSAEGAALKISRNNSAPCSVGVVVTGAPDCQQDAFYYVDDTDRIAGSTALGAGSGRRVPSDIQGTGCECGALSGPYQALAPSGRSGLDAQCNEFFRGGRIDYVFLREDTDPPFPQVVWRVTDSGGARAQDFDPRANIR